MMWDDRPDESSRPWRWGQRILWAGIVAIYVWFLGPVVLKWVGEVLR